MLTYLSSFSCLIPLLLYVFLRPKGAEKTILYLLIYLVISFTVDILTSFFLDSFRELRVSLYYLFLFSELALFYLIISHFINSTSLRKVALLISGIVVVFSIIRLFNLERFRNDSIVTGTEHLAIVIMCLFYYFDQVKTVDYSKELKEVKPLSSKFEFWQITGIFISMSASFFLYIFLNSLSATERNNYYFLLYACNIIQNIFFCIAIIVAARNNTKKQLT